MIDRYTINTRHDRYMIRYIYIYIYIYLHAQKEMKRDRETERERPMVWRQHWLYDRRRIPNHLDMHDICTLCNRYISQDSKLSFNTRGPTKRVNISLPYALRDFFDVTLMCLCNQ